MAKDVSGCFINTSEANQELNLPKHPFFESAENQASFVECIEAVDRVRAVMALCNHLDLDESRGGLTDDAAHGYYWIRVLQEEALSYVSKWLMELHTETKK